MQRAPIEGRGRKLFRPFGSTALLLAALLWQPGTQAEALTARAVRLGDTLSIPVFSAPASVIARDEPRLAAEIEARIVEIPVRVGDLVNSGDVLARLDCRRHESLLAASRADLARAKASRQFAEEQLKRARNLRKNNSISEEVLDQRQTDLAAANAELQVREETVRQAIIDTGHCEVRAPFDAVVTDRLASVGGYATRGTAIVGLLETQGQEVSVALHQDQIAGLQAAGSLTFSSNGTEYPVELRALLPAADPVARTREARLVFTGQTAVPGAAGRVKWSGGRSLLPADYLVRRSGELGVFLLEGGLARFVPLPQAEDGRPVEVTLPPDAQLITDGRQRLVDGDKVRLVPAGERPR